MLKLVGSTDLEYPGACMALAPDGSMLATGNLRGQVSIWSFPELRLATSFQGHSEGTTCMAFTPRGDYLVGGGSGGVRLWRRPGWELTREIGRFDGRTVGVFSLCITRDQHYLCAVGHDEPVLPPPKKESSSDAARGSFRYLRLWTFPSGELVKEVVRGWTSPFDCIVASPNGSMLATADDSGVALWSMPDANHIKTLHDIQRGYYCLAISPDGRLLACASKDGHVLVYTLPDGNLFVTLSGHKGAVMSVAFSPDSKLLASGAYDMSIRTWLMPEGKELDCKPSYPIVSKDLAFSSDGRLLFCMGSTAGMVEGATPQIQVYQV